MFFHPRSRKGKQHNQRKTSLPGRSRCGSRAGRFYFIRENVENQSGEALLDLGQVGQLVEDLGVVEHAAELLRTHAVGVDVHHGTGVGVGGMIFPTKSSDKFNLSNFHKCKIIFLFIK